MEKLISFEQNKNKTMINKKRKKDIDNNFMPY